MLQYLEVLDRIFTRGNDRATRNGSTRALFAEQMRFDLREGFPILTTKEVAWKIVVAELLWFLEGGARSPISYRMSNIRFREFLGYASDRPTIWSHDEMKPEWQEKARFPGDCGRIYGAQWRNWNGSVDQIANLIRLLRTDPVSRYLKVMAWNPSETGDMCLPPCHGDFQCFVTFDEDGMKQLSLHMVQRSCDMFLGVPFNIASYGLLLHMFAQVSGMLPGELVITLNDAHIYHEHFDAVRTQLNRAPGELASLRLNPAITEIDQFTMGDIELVGYVHQGKISAKLL